MTIILAARGGITTHFHEDIGRGFLHRGIDQGHGDSTPADLEIRAPAAGRVIAVGPDGSYGDRLILLHDDWCTSLLAHHAAQFVKVGDRVAKRQLIARMGNTGTIFVHSHQEYRDKFGNQLDPLLHLDAASAALDLTELPALAPQQIGHPDMRVILHTTHASDGSGKVIGIMHYKVGELTCRPLTTQVEVDVAVSVYGPPVPVDDARFDAFISTVNDNIAAIRRSA